MASSSKKSAKSTIVKKQASAKQAYKKNSKKGNKKAQNEQLLDLLDQNALNTIQEATNVRFLRSMVLYYFLMFVKSTKPIQPDFSALYQGNQAQSILNDLASSMQKVM